MWDNIACFAGTDGGGGGEGEIKDVPKADTHQIGAGKDTLASIHPQAYGAPLRAPPPEKVLVLFS